MCLGFCELPWGGRHWVTPSSSPAALGWGGSQYHIQLIIISLADFQALSVRFLRTNLGFSILTDLKAFTLWWLPRSVKCTFNCDLCVTALLIRTWTSSFWLWQPAGCGSFPLLCLCADYTPHSALLLFLRTHTGRSVPDRWQQYSSAEAPKYLLW